MPKTVREPTALGDRVLNPGMLFADDHPLVKSNPGAFVELFNEDDIEEADGKTRGEKRVKPVEQATAAPGEKRAVSRK